MTFKLANTERTEETYQAIKDRSEKRYRCGCGQSGAMIEFAFTLFPDKSEAACCYCGKVHTINIEDGKMHLTPTKRNIDGNYMEDL